MGSGQKVPELFELRSWQHCFDVRNVRRSGGEMFEKNN